MNDFPRLGGGIFFAKKLAVQIEETFSGFTIKK